VGVGKEGPISVRARSTKVMAEALVILISSDSEVSDSLFESSPRWGRAPVAQRIEHLTTDQKVWGSNPYRRADRIHRMTCVNGLTRVALHCGSGPSPSQIPAQKLSAGRSSPRVASGRVPHRVPLKSGSVPHVPPVV
jgi:hypothetical protein